MDGYNILRETPKGHEMTIDELISEFFKLYDAPKFNFRTPIYRQWHNNITAFIFENHLEGTQEWKCISDNLLYKSNQTMVKSEANTISINLELIKRKLLSRKNEAFWEYIHHTIQDLTYEKFNGGQYADSVETAFKGINSRLKAICKKLGYEEKDGATLMNFVFSEEKAILKFEDTSTRSGSDVQKGFMQIFAGAMTGIRNPKAHENKTITKEAAVKLLIFASLLMDKIDEAVSYTNIDEC